MLRIIHYCTIDNMILEIALFLIILLLAYYIYKACTKKQSFRLVMKCKWVYYPDRALCFFFVQVSLGPHTVVAYQVKLKLNFVSWNLIFSHRKLKTELHELRKKAAVNPDDEHTSNTNGCARCHEEYGLFSSGNQCPKCKHHVCPKCQVFTPTGKRWLCVVCHKAM